MEFSEFVSPSAIPGDGAVLDAVVVRSSGHHAGDKLALMLYRGARYTLRLGAKDPAPHVVTQTTVLTALANEARGLVDYSSPNYHMGPTGK